MKLYKIKKSDIDKKGRGLYATKDIKEGTRIIDYVGKIITKKQTEESQKFDNAKPIYLFNLNKKYDLVFIDADKENYANYFDIVIDSLRPGGIIIADNVLWSGKVLKETEAKDEETRALKVFNEKVFADERVESVLLPIRDGLMVLRKK